MAFSVVVYFVIFFIMMKSNKFNENFLNTYIVVI